VVLCSLFSLFFFFLKPLCAILPPSPSLPLPCALCWKPQVLLPLAIGFSLRSLVVEQHHGWYSWLVASLTGSCYTFGFILMTPQLFINHHLKSVSHLPWKFLGFRFVNTFIDDLFAFIIRMPTMHRISCFRDDIVFFIYL